MNSMRSVLRRLGAFLRKSSADAELDEELRAHLDALTEENIRRGMAPEEARCAARREFGGIQQTKELYREQRSLPFVEVLLQDARYALRVLKASPGLTCIAAISLAIGIGGNAAIFSVVNGVLLRPLAYPGAERLVTPTGQYPKGAFEAIEARSRSMEIAAYTYSSDPQFCHFNLTGSGEAMRVLGSSVSDNLFAVLDAEAELGRTFRTGENRPGRDRLVILSHALWRNKFAGDPRIIGRPITIDGVDREIVGVMPAAFGFPTSQVQMWLPLHIDPSAAFEQWNTGFMPLVARLRPGATMEQARNELRPLILQILPQFPYNMPRTWNADATVIPLQQNLIGDVRSKLLVLQLAIGVVLLITCANVASLLLSRAVVRRKEMALRAALGAARGRIVRQLLTESVVLAIMGGAVGLALAYEGLRVLTLAVPISAPGFAQVRIDGNVLAFAAGLALLTGIGFGLLPALSASRADLAGAMRIGGRCSGGSQGERLRSLLIASETALAVVLAVSAGLLIKSLWRLTEVDPGFRPQHIVTVGVFPDKTACSERASCIALYAELIRRAHGVSGVSSVAAANVLPLTGEVPSIPTEVEGHPLVSGESLGPGFWASAVTPEYFRIMGIPLFAGRTFDDSDGENTTPVILVSRATAELFWPGENPIGKHIRALWDKEPWRTVVGVVGDVRQYDLSGRSPSWVKGTLYMPYAQSVGNDRRPPTAMALLVQTGADNVRVAEQVHDIVSQLNPNVPVGAVQTMEGIVTASTTGPRSLMWLFVGFACMALLLAAIGTYGVISHSATQRAYEMGVRIALGATPGRIFGLVMGESLRLALYGLGAGVVASLALTRILSAFLYGTTSQDPIIFAAVAALLILVALLAGFLPARRAARVDPNVALRCD